MDSLSLICSRIMFGVCPKEVDEAIHALIVNVYVKCGISHKILSKSGLELENSIFAEMASALGVHKCTVLPTILEEMATLKACTIS